MGNKTSVVLDRHGKMPMPLDVVVTYTDGTMENFYIPLEMMRGEKQESIYSKTTLLPDWPWTYPEYSFSIDRPITSIQRILIDPTHRMADINPDDNAYPTLTDGTRMNGTSEK